MTRRTRSLAALAATVSVSFGALLYAFSVLITERAAGAEFSTGLLSTAYGGTVLVGGGMAFAIGRVVDSRGVRMVMGVGSVTGALGLAGLALSTQGWQVVAASWFLIGPAGAMTFYEPAFVALDQWFEPAERGRAIGILTVVGGLAGPVFLPLTAALVESVGWRPTAGILAGIVAAVGLVAASLALPSGRPALSELSPPRVTLRTLLSDSRFRLYTGSVLLLFGAFQTVIFHRIALFEGGGFGIALVSFWAGVSGWLSFPGRYFGPILASGTRGVRWNAAVAGLLALTVLPMLAPGNRLLMTVHFVAFGLVFGAVLPMRAAVMGTWFSGQTFGRIMGIQWTLAALAGAAAPALAGFSRDTTGSYQGAVVGVIIALLASAGLILASERPRPERTGL